MVAHLLRGGFESAELFTRKPGHGEEALGGEIRDELRHGDEGLVREHGAVEGHVLGLAGVVEFLAQAVGDFLDHRVGIDRAVHALEHAEQGAQLADIGFNRAGHVRILQLAGNLAAIVQRGAVDLAEGGGVRGLVGEAGELCLPPWPELGAHAALDEGPAQGRSLGLQLTEFGGVFGRQEIRDCGDQLRDLHQRAFGLAEGGSEGFGGALVPLVAAEKGLGREGEARTGEVCADLRGARYAAREAVAFGIVRSGGFIGHAADIEGRRLL